MKKTLANVVVFAVIVILAACQINPKANDPAIDFSIDAWSERQLDMFNINVWLLRNSGNGDAVQVTTTLRLYGFDGTTELQWVLDSGHQDPGFPKSIKAEYSDPSDKAYTWFGYASDVPYYYKFTVDYEDADGNEMTPIEQFNQCRVQQ
jgi:hypothetical protein